jgi:hypothetical protein
MCKKIIVCGMQQEHCLRCGKNIARGRNQEHCLR